MTVRRFERLVQKSPFTFASFEAVPIKKLKRVANRLSREFTTSIVRCRTSRDRHGPPEAVLELLEPARVLDKAREVRFGVDARQCERIACAIGQPAFRRHGQAVTRAPHGIAHARVVVAVGIAEQRDFAAEHLFETSPRLPQLKGELSGVEVRKDWMRHRVRADVDAAGAISRAWSHVSARHAAGGSGGSVTPASFSIAVIRRSFSVSGSPLSSAFVRSASR